MGRPAGSKSRPDGYDRPDVMPDDAAELAALRYETRTVREKRAQGVSWANIARMLGKAEIQLRRDHEDVR